MRTSGPAAAIAVAAGVLALGGTARAQQTLPPQAKPHAAAAAGTTAHVEGCVFPKAALGTTSRVTPPPEGSTARYVLTNTKVIAVAPGTAIEEGATLDIQDADQERLRALIGKHTGVTGRIEKNGTATQLIVTSIVETVGECPVVPPRS